MQVAALRVEFAKIKETVDRIKVLQEDLFNSASRDKGKQLPRDKQFCLQLFYVNLRFLQIRKMSWTL